MKYSPAPDTSTSLNKQEIKRVEEIAGTFLCNVQAFDSKLLEALGTIATQTHEAI